MFDKSQIKSFVKQTKSEAGDGWAMLGPRIQHALIAERAFSIIRGQAADAVSVESMDQLLHGMLAEAGLEK